MDNFNKMVPLFQETPKCVQFFLYKTFPTWLLDPICSMYGIFTNIYPINEPNVGKYSIHGAYGDALKKNLSWLPRKFHPGMAGSLQWGMGFPKPWGYPKMEGWFKKNMENPNRKWMMAGVATFQETTFPGLSMSLHVLKKR